MVLYFSNIHKALHVLEIFIYSQCRLSFNRQLIRNFYMWKSCQVWKQDRRYMVKLFIWIWGLNFYPNTVMWHDSYVHSLISCIFCYGMPMYSHFTFFSSRTCRFIFQSSSADSSKERIETFLFHAISMIDLHKHTWRLCWLGCCVLNSQGSIGAWVFPSVG